MTTSTLILRPNADDSVALTPTPSGTHYTCVDEETEDTGDYLQETASTTLNETKDVNATDRFGLPNHSTESGVISKVRVKARAAYAFLLGNFYAAQIKLGLYINSTEYFASAQNLTTSDATYYNEWTVNLNTSAAFTWSDIDNLKVLLNLRAAITAVSDGKGGYGGSLNSDDYQCWIEVDYETGVYKDIAGRFRLIAQTYKTIATRFKLAVQGYKDIASRITVLLGNYKDIAARFKILLPMYKAIAGRFKITATNYADMIGRFSLYAGTYKNIAARFKIWAIGYKDIAARFKLSNSQYQYFISRFVLYAGTYKNIAGRFKMTAQTYKDIAGRFAVYIRWAYKNIATRFKVTVRNYGAIAARFVITAISVVDPIVTAMKELNITEALKVGIQGFDWPIREESISLESFSFKPVYDIADLSYPIQAVSPSDKSIIVLDAALGPSKPGGEAPAVFNGSIVYVTVTNGGSGYSDDPVITITDQNGSGAVLTPVFDGNGILASVTITNGGSGYIVPPQLSFYGMTYMVGGGPAHGPVIHANVTNGVITSVVIDRGGDNISSGSILVGARPMRAKAIVLGGVIKQIIIPKTNMYSTHWDDAYYTLQYNKYFTFYPSLPRVTITDSTGINAQAIVSDSQKDCVAALNYKDDLVVDSTVSTWTDTSPLPPIPTFEIKITSIGAQDKFKWRLTGGLWSAELNCTLTTQQILYSATVWIDIHFAAITGHTLNSIWIIPWGWSSDSSRSFIPGNLNDISITGNSSKFAGITYTFTITSTGATDKFKWLKTGDVSTDPTEDVLSAEINCSTSPIEIEAGIYVSFGSITGHILYDQWTTTISQIYGSYTIRRYVNSSGTDFVPIQTPASPTTISVNHNEWSNNTLTNINSLAICANKNSAEVVIAAWIYSSGVNYLKTKTSTDCGVTWGAWTTIYSDATYPYIEGNISIGMNDNGDIGLLSHRGTYLVTDVSVTNSVPMTRTNGTWATLPLLSVTTTAKQLAWDIVFGWYLFTPGTLTSLTGGSQIVDATPSKTTTAELTSYIRNQQLDYKYNDPVQSFTPYMQEQLFKGWSVTPYYDYGGQGWSVTPIYKTIDRYAREVIASGTYTEATISSTGFWLAPNDGEFIVQGGSTYYIIYKDTIDKMKKARHSAFTTDRQAILAGTADYVLLIHDHCMYFSEYPYDWTPPEDTPVLGDELVLNTERIVKVVEEVNDTESSVMILLNNYDGYFDTIGSGDLANFKIGSRINLSVGYRISSVDQVEDYQHYYIQNFADVRGDNFRGFLIFGVNGQWRLKNYQFPRQVFYNEVLEPGVKNKETTAQEIINDMVNSIGGQLTYVSKSSAMTQSYPVLNIAPLQTPDAIISAIFGNTTDILIWDGINATMKNPSLDIAVWRYGFPKPNITDCLPLYYPLIKHQSLGINHVYIQATDSSLRTIFGEAQDAELNPEIIYSANVGELEDWETATDRAIRVLRQVVLRRDRGQFVSNPNPFLKRFDVISLIDANCNQNTNYRVSGWQFVYQKYISGLQPWRYDQTIRLTDI